MGGAGVRGLQKSLEGLIKGDSITDNRILPKLLKLATLPLKIAHPYSLAPLYHGSSKCFPSFCSFPSLMVTFRL